MFSKVHTTTTYSALAVIIGALLVSAAIFTSREASLSEGTMTIQRAIPAERHLYGSKNAETIIVEFSDYQCPYCARVHATLKQLVDESEGTIAWEYRHLPLSFHPHALPTALVSECVASIAGNDAFWEFTNTIFADQSRLTPAYALEVAARVGASNEALQSCITDDAVEEKVYTDMDTAELLGGSGTPYSVIIFPDGSYKPISGAVPLEQWQAVIRSYATN